MNNAEIESIKEGVFQSLEKRGVLENLKAYLRSNLYSNMKNKENVIKCNYREYDVDKLKLIKLSMSLISDYMKKLNMHYAHSVFMPECNNIIGTDLYTEREIANLYDISYESLEKEDDCAGSLLNYVIKTRVMRGYGKTMQDESLQTDNLNGRDAEVTMEDRLRQIDKKYNREINFESFMPAKAIEEKMLKYQKEMEARYKQDLEREIIRVKEMEISNVRIEENRKYMRKLEDIREEYEKEFRDKIESLKIRENEIGMKIGYKEKDLEMMIYDNRQKFLLELELLKQKEEELKRKHDNNFNNLKLEEEKLRFKQKEMDYIKDSSLKKINEEIEQFKLEYDRMFELEKNEFKRKKLEVEEREFKNNLFVEKLNQFEKESKMFSQENSQLREELNLLQKTYDTIRKDNDMLREELKLLASNEKRNSEMFAKSQLENGYLKDENKIVKETVDNQRKLNEERKNEQMLLTENLKKQLDDNMERFQKSKEHYEMENERIKKYYLSNLEREKESYDSKMRELDKKISILEDTCKKYKELYNQLSRKTSENKIAVSSSMNFKGGENNFNSSLRMNNYFNNMNDMKATDRLINWSKLEKESDEVKNELKRSFVLASKRDIPVMASQNISSIQVDKIYYDIYEKMKNEKLVEIASKVTQEIQPTQPSNQINLQNIRETNKTDQEVKIPPNNKMNNINTSDVKPTNTINTVNTMIKSDENILNSIHNFDSKREAHKILKESDTNTNTNTNANNITKKNVEIKEELNVQIPINNTSKVVDEKNIDKKEEKPAISNLERELNKMKEEYGKKQEALPTPAVISGANNLSVRSQKDDSDFSVGNITSSNEWELESNRRDLHTVKITTLNPTPTSSLIANVASTTKKEEPINTFFASDNKKETPKIENKNTANTANTSNITSTANIATPNTNIAANTKPLNKSKVINTSIKEEPEESYNISNFIGKSNISEDLHKSSYNKFSNLPVDTEKNEIDEEIKTEQSEEYGNDFVEDADALVEKKASIDFEAYKNASLNFNNTSNIRANNLNVSKSYQQSMDKMDKFLQSKSSYVEENIVEEYSVESSKRENKQVQNKSNTIDEYNDYNFSGTNVNVVSANNNSVVKNVMKDVNKESTQRQNESKTSEINEEIQNEEDSVLEPINYDF